MKFNPIITTLSPRPVISSCISLMEGFSVGMKWLRSSPDNWVTVEAALSYPTYQYRSKPYCESTFPHLKFGVSPRGDYLFIYRWFYFGFYLLRFGSHFMLLMHFLRHQMLSRIDRLNFRFASFYLLRVLLGYFWGTNGSTGYLTGWTSGLLAFISCTGGSCIIWGADGSTWQVSLQVCLWPLISHLTGDFFRFYSIPELFFIPE